MVWSRPLPSAPTSVTVYRDRAGRWWASFVCRIEVPEHPAAPTGRSTGLDVGLATFATVEDPEHDVGTHISPRMTTKAKKKADRQLARKQSGSTQPGQGTPARARLDAKVANQRADFHHKTARALVKVYDRIGVEDLNIKNMTNRGKGPSQARAEPLDRRRRLGPFQQILAWQAAKAGTQWWFRRCGTALSAVVIAGRKPSPVWSCRTGSSDADVAVSSSDETATRPGT